MDELLFKYIQQALSDINPKIPALYFENLDLSCVASNCITPVYSMKRLIDISFVWRRTPEGFLFWKEIYENPILLHKQIEATMYGRSDLIKVLRDCKQYYLTTKGLKCLE